MKVILLVAAGLLGLAALAIVGIFAYTGYQFWKGWGRGW